MKKKIFVTLIFTLSVFVSHTLKAKNVKYFLEEPIEMIRGEGLVRTNKLIIKALKKNPEELLKLYLAFIQKCK